MLDSSAVRRRLDVVPGTAGPRAARVSVTERCDLACLYCRPPRSAPQREDRLPLSAWEAVFQGLRRAGVRRVRLTGGEPLLHPAIVDIVGVAAAVGFDDVALTTNATRLARLAGPLRRAGLARVNVSLDSLDEARFAALTRGGALPRVLDGLDAALDAGFSPVKLNTVVLRGINDDELEHILGFAWERRLVPRFIEVMPVGEGAHLGGARLVPVAEMRQRLAGLLAPEEARVEPDRGPARYVPSRADPTLRAGFISGATETYCAGCDRLRVSSSGLLRPCLATDLGVPAGAAAAVADVDAIERQIAAAWAARPDPDSWKGCSEDSAARVSMCAVGG